MKEMLLVGSGDKNKILDFFHKSQDLGSLGHIRRGLFYEKFGLGAKNPLPSEFENFWEICFTVATTT